ncbi:MAG: hypothetical protein HQ592_13910 [Planctomycetes bacterium]|nr:hypothetical protein [Planctomycetota bacterium]
MKTVVTFAFVALLAGSCVSCEAQKRAGKQADQPGTVAGDAPQEDPLGRFYETIALREPLGVEWAPQMVRVPVEFRNRCLAETLELRDSAGDAVPFQVVDPVYEKKALVRCSVAFVTGLAPLQRCSYRLHYDEKAAKQKKSRLRSKLQEQPLLVRKTILKSVMTSGDTSLLILSGTGTPRNPAPAWSVPPPIASVRGADGVWRGRGELRSPFEVKSWKADILAAGPIFARVRVRYEFTEEHFYEVDFSAVAGSGLITVSERFDLGQPSCLILRGLNTLSEEVPKQGNADVVAAIISRLTAHCGGGAAIAGLPAKRFESVAAIDGKDMFALFSVAPGRWQNPVEVEINFTRLDGSLIFHLPLGKGERRWGIHATTLAGGSTQNIYRTVGRACDVPLDAVLKMDLENEPPPVKDPAPDVPELGAAAGIVSRAVKAVLDQGFSGPPSEGLDLLRVARSGRVWQRLKAAGNADTPAGALMRGHLVFLANVMHDPSFFAWNALLNENARPGANFDPESINWLRNIERFAALAGIASALPDHPRAGQWLAHAESQFALTLEQLVTPWGAWKPGDADHQRACGLLGPAADTLKAAGRRDFHKHPAFRAMKRYLPLKK